MEKVKRDTSEDLFNNVLELVKKEGHYSKAEEILEYSLVDKLDKIDLTNYEFSFMAIVSWGGSEGIYLDCYIKGDFGCKHTNNLHIGTFKTLDTSIEAFKIMGELSGAMTYYADLYVNQNLKRYEPN